MSTSPLTDRQRQRVHADRVRGILFAAAWSAAAAVLLIFIGGQILTAMYAATNFSGVAVNGAFQLYNPLRRIEVGQIPGRDFPFFHGVAIPWLHYPIFAALGGGLFGSEIARILVSPALFLLSSAIFFRAFFKSWRTALIATAVFVCLSPLITEVGEHGNSLLGVRSTVPVLIAALMFWSPRRHWKRFGVSINAQVVSIIVLLGLAFVLGTEQGIAALGGYFIVRLIVLWRHEKSWKVLIQLAAEGFATIGSIFLWLTLTTGGHPLEALRYALIDVPQDQTWYFGTLPNPYLTVDSFFSLTFHGLPLVIIITSVLTIALTILASRLGLLSIRERRAILYMAVAGILTCGSFAGYFWPQNQMSPLGRLVGLVFVAIVLRLVFEATPERFANSWVKSSIWPRRTLQALVAIAAIIGVAIASVGYYTEARQFSAKTTIKAALAAPGLDDTAVTASGWTHTIRLFEPYLKGSEFWSNWAGLHEANAGVLHPSSAGEDYIIHALGTDRRKQYGQQFIDDHPEYAITLNPAYSGFEGWLWSPHSDFYKQLFTSYDLVLPSSPHFLWKARNTPPEDPEPWVEAAVGDDGSFSIDRESADRTQLVEVEVRYQASANLPFLDKLPRYFLTAKNSGLVFPVSLPSFEDEFTLLVPLIQGQDTSTVVASVDGIIPTATLEVTSARYRILPIPEGNELVFSTNYCPSRASDQDSTAVC